MVKIWKIGAWPGIWGDDSSETKEKYINEYALKYGFVAIGYGWVPNLSKLSKEQIRNYLSEEYKKRKRNPNLSRKTNEVYNFAKEIKENDIILLYTRYKAYVGTVIKEGSGNPYYYVEKGSEKDIIVGTEGEDMAPHRIDVHWEFNKNRFDGIDFSMWRDTVHQVLEDDIKKIENNSLKEYLKQKMDP